MAAITASMKWSGGLRFDGVSAFGHPIATDVSRTGGGDESGYKPSELMLFGLAGCTGVDVVRILQKMQQKVTGIVIEVTGHQNDEYPKPFHTVEIKFIVSGEHLDSEKVGRAIALSEEKYCLVSQTIKSPGTVTTSFEIRVQPISGTSLTNGLETQIAYTLKTTKSFDDVVTALSTSATQHKFRVLHIHDVQATLAEKGLVRGPLKILEVCNSEFANAALQKDVNVSLFMPCKFSVYTEGPETIVTLARPTAMSRMMPGAELETLAEAVEATLKTIMHEVV